MATGPTFKNDILGAILNATPIANLLDDAASSPLTELYVSLHTADPAGNDAQTTSEANYTGYARVAVNRNNATKKWTVSAGSAVNVDAITFPACTGGSSTVTYLAVGTAASGSGKILASGALSAPSGGLAVTNGVTPAFAAGQASVTVS